MKKKVIVTGSGPAGLAAAYNAALHGAKVTLLEQMPRFGMKLLASGGGKCNVTNSLELEDFALRFGRNWRFLLPALRTFHGRELLDFFELHGVKLVKKDGFHYFPASSSSASILEMWLSELKRLKVELKTGVCVKELVIEDNAVKAVRSSDSEYPCDAVILACGGKSYPALGGRGKGYELAGQAGHSVTKLFPAMTGVKCREEWVKECSGISLDDCTAYIDLKGDRKNIQRGELLFTRSGFSAFAILDIAGRVAELLSQGTSVPLVIDFAPHISHEQWMEKFSNWRQTQGKKLVSTLLSEYFPRRLAENLLDDCDCQACQFPAKATASLLTNIKEHTFELTGTESWDKAMVTMGGVALKNIDPDTLQSTITKGVFFAGELLDVTGPCGGYNITWALASGMCAGIAASEIL